MIRLRFVCLVTAAVTLTVAGCVGSDSIPTVPRSTPALNRAPTLSLDTEIQAIIEASYPQGTGSAISTRWENVKRQLGRPQEGPNAAARSQLVELVDYVQKKADDITPPAGQSQAQVAAQLVLDMSVYVYQGPDAPAVPVGADVAMAIVQPTSPATLVTPAKRAAVQIEAGSVAEPTIVVVAQNATDYPQGCSGPLDTRLCQIPRFYRFEEFPHVRLLKPARFAVCHVTTGGRAPSPAIHDRLVLAHTAPADPADDTPDGTRIDGIEILPVVTLLGVVDCGANKGGGGLALAFSDFNVVDPVPQVGNARIIETLIATNFVYNISDSGMVVGGLATTGFLDSGPAFAWTPATGVQALWPNGTAWGVNAAGTVVGERATPDHRSSHAMVWQSGVATPLGIGDAEVITRGGAIGGCLYGATGFAGKPAYWIGTVATELPLPPTATEGCVFGLNDNGDAAGYVGVGGTTYLPASWLLGTFQPIPLLPTMQRGVANSVNSAGQVVGWQNRSASASQSGLSQAYMWSNGVLTVLPPLVSNTSTSTEKINEIGQVAGGSGGRAVVWDGGVPYALPVPSDATSSYAAAINNVGQVAGWVRSAAGFRVVVWDMGRPIVPQVPQP